MSRRIALAAIIPGLLAALTACSPVTYQTGLKMAGESHIESQIFFLWGLIGESNVFLDQICPSGVAWFQSRHTFVDGLIGTFTIGLVHPLTVEVVCSDGQAWRATPEGEGAWVASVDPLSIEPVGPLPPLPFDGAVSSVEVR